MGTPGPVEWQFYTQSKTGVFYTWLNGAYDIQGEWFVSRAGALRIKIPFDGLDSGLSLSPTLGIPRSWSLHESIMPMLAELVAVRNGVIVFAGPILDVTVSTKEHHLTIQAGSLETYMDFTFVQNTWSHTAADPQEIAWSVLSNSLYTTMLNITQGSKYNTQVYTADFSWPTNSGSDTTSQVLETVRQLTSAGFDYSIAPDTRKFLTWGLIKRKYVEYSIGDDNRVPTTSISIQVNGASLVNKLEWTGPAGSGDIASAANVWFPQAKATMSFSSYGTPSAAAGAAQSYVNRYSKPQNWLQFVTTDNILDPWGDAVVEGTEQPVMTGHNMTIGLNVDGGDFAPYRTDSTYETFTINGFQVTVSASGAETVQWYSRLSG